MNSLGLLSVWSHTVTNKSFIHNLASIRSNNLSNRRFEQFPSEVSTGAAGSHEQKSHWQECLGREKCSYDWQLRKIIDTSLVIVSKRLVLFIVLWESLHWFPSDTPSLLLIPHRCLLRH